MPSQKSSKTKNSRNQLTTSTPLKKSKSKRNGFVFSLVGVHGVGKTTVYSLLQSMFEDYTNIHFLSRTDEYKSSLSIWFAR